MSKQQPFTIGGLLFSTKQALQTEIRNRLAGYEDREPFSAEDECFFLDLLDHHPMSAIKIGCGVTGFYVAQNPVYKNTRCLYLLRADGSSTDWSWTECLRPTPHDKKVQRAFRALLEPQMIAIKQEFFGTSTDTVPCPLTGRPMTFTTAHVDHIPPQTFAALFHAFVHHEQLDLTTVSFRAEGEDHNYQDVLADAELASRWLAYHARYARLRVISARANLSEVKRGWGDGTNTTTNSDR